MGLWIIDSKASTQEIERGIAAAKAHFEEKGFHPQACWQAVLSSTELVEPTTDKDMLALIDTWDEADNIARTACFAGWVTVPESAMLVWE